MCWRSNTTLSENEGTVFTLASPDASGEALSYLRPGCLITYADSGFQRILAEIDQHKANIENKHSQRQPVIQKRRVKSVVMKTADRSGNILWRWGALLAVMINIFFNYYMNANPPGGLTNAEVSAKYPTLFTPAGYAFSIWGLIYLLFIIYVIIQLLPSQRKHPLYDRLAIPLIITSILSICWLFSFSYELLLLSIGIISLMLLTAILLFTRSKRAGLQDIVNKLISIPFALYAGWLTVATIANIAVWLTSIGWQGGQFGEMPWTLIMIGVAAVLAIVVSYKWKDVVFPLVVVWAIIAIYAARQNQEQTVATFALITGIILMLWVIGYGILLWRKQQLQLAV